MYYQLLLLSQLLYSGEDVQSINNYKNTLMVGNKSKWLKPETVVVISSKKQLGTNKGSFQDMLEALGVRETGLLSGDPKQYQFENPSLGFLGKYQFAEILLIRLGYYKANVFYGRGADKNYWRGAWTKKNGIDSKSKFLNSPEVQEKAIREAFRVYWQDINDILKRQGKSINNYLGYQKTFSDRGQSKTITITLSGILAGAHLRGPHRLVELLVQGKVSQDEFGTSILDYVEEFGSYETTIKDF